MTETIFKKINKNVIKIISGIFLRMQRAKKSRPTFAYLFFVFIFVGLVFLHIHQVSALTTTNSIVATGGTITTIRQNGQIYKVHTFTSSGTFTVTKGSGRVWYLVVAGGGAGGGGGAPGGGGGAGGYRTNDTYTYPVNAGAYTVTVGAGGTYPAGNGNNSVFDTITSTGGGSGCAYYSGNAAAVGGSGGGGCGYGNPASAAGTTGQGNAGGIGQYFGAYEAGGGGGAGAVGADASAGQSGNGGIGKSSLISGSSVYYAGGGGSTATLQGALAGTGGNGGGGAGANPHGSTATSGTANTGGGGGASHEGAGGAGGSGIVIIRYPVSATTKPIQKGGLVARWTFDTQDISGTTAYDKGGIGYNGTISGATATAGKVGQALSFNGTSDVASATVSSGLSGSFTFSAWIYPTSNASGSGAILDSDVASYSNYWASLYRGTPQSFNGSFSLYDGSNNPNVNTGDVPPLNTWTHLVGVRNTLTDKISIYENGVFKNETTDTTTSIPSYSAFNIGAQLTQANRYFPGKIDDVRIYSRALSATEIQQLYKETETKQNTSPVKGITSGLVGYWNFDGKNLTSATATNIIGASDGARGGTTVAIGKFGQALRFNGSSDYVRIANYSALNTTSALTYSYWVKPSSFSVAMNTISNHIQSISSPISGVVLSIGTDGKPTFQLRVGNSCCQTLTNSTALQTGKWYHVVATWDGSTMKQYINGVQDANTTNVSGTLSVNRDTFIGTNAENFFGSPSNYFNGVIDEVRIYNRALSATEVLQLYKMGAR